MAIGTPGGLDLRGSGLACPMLFKILPARGQTFFAVQVPDGSRENPAQFSEYFNKVNPNAVL